MFRFLFSFSLLSNSPFLTVPGSIETENESKEADKDLVSGFNNIMSDLFGSKGKQESDNLREQTDEKKANSIIQQKKCFLKVVKP